ncbi:peptidase M12 [Corallococcus terminator]|uniref:Peptidase M12 n=1 Tax=Corallococcus terminator TaxID=2316733 RepID=A0A3A8J3L7_9BACT|nr:peptidase M12 [Corallococcus terminator]RKG90055.1 peptidase M12 [Corallococcus terminator]
MSETERYRDALLKIAELARKATQEYKPSEREHGNGHGRVVVTPASRGGCSLKVLPSRLLVKAAEVARKINPVNAPQAGPMAAVGADLPLDPLRIALLTSKYWGPATRELTVSFMESAPADLRARIVSHLNAWATSGGVSFIETNGTGDIRISRGPGGYWSYLGTDVKLIPTDEPTMNLEGFTMSTPDSEYSRVVRHEAGHTLGFPHEHMRRELVARIDPDKAYAYFLATQGWDKETVDQQVLTPLDDQSIFATPADQTSIMCYQLPSSITRDGQPILGGLDINVTDYVFAGLIYPKFNFEDLEAVRKTKPKPGEDVAASMGQVGVKDWGAARDPQLSM